MARAGLYHQERGPGNARRTASTVEFWLNEIQRLEPRRIRICDVLGQHALAFLMPLHFRAEHGERRDVTDCHRQFSKGRQNLPTAWLIFGKCTSPRHIAPTIKLVSRGDDQVGGTPRCFQDKRRRALVQSVIVALVEDIVHE